MKNLKNIHPGEILLQEFLIPLEITAYRLSKEISIPQTRISEIIKGNRRITADTALRLSKFFGNSAKFWLGLQDDFDLEDELKNKDYYYQLQGYMWLTDKQEALLCYCLVDTPLQIVEDEIRREHWKQNLISESSDLREFVEDKHMFGHIPIEKRVKTHVVKRDDEVIEAIKTRIEECNEYYNEIIDLI